MCADALQAFAGRDAAFSRDGAHDGAAARLGQWLFGRTLTASSDTPEIEVPLDRPVPIYVAYLTAVPSGSQIVFFDDIYGKDRAQLAAANQGSLAAR